MVAGRLGAGSRYSGRIVYNCFPWPEVTPQQRALVEKTAQGIIDARALYPNVSLAKMYGSHMKLFPELIAAHKANDEAVIAAYGITPNDVEYHDEMALQAFLLKLYQQLVDKKNARTDND